MRRIQVQASVRFRRRTVPRDCLTGCYDRMTIQHLVDLCFLKSDVRQSHAMFVIDVDNFKRVNDTWGREFGDIVLNDVAAVLRRIFRGIGKLFGARAVLRNISFEVHPGGPYAEGMRIIP